MSDEISIRQEFGLSDEELYHFDTRGFLVKKHFLSPDEVARAEAALAALWPDEPQSVSRISDIAQHTFFRSLALRIANESGIHDTINQPFRLTESYALRRSHGSVQALHNGRSNANKSAVGKSHRAMWREHAYHDGLLYCMMVKALVYLTDVTSEADGPFTFVEGSHKANYPFPIPRRELKRGAGFTWPGTHQVYARAGDMLLLNEALTHGSCSKSSPGMRVFVAFSYGPSFVSDYGRLPAGPIHLSQVGFCE